MHYYCLFCQTQHCAAIRRSLTEVLDCKAIYSLWVQQKWVKGRLEESEKALLPGYVFLYTETPLLDFSRVRRAQGVVRLLGDEENGLELTNQDRAFAEMLLKTDGRLGRVKVYKEGERLKLSKGLLAGFEGEIVKVDHQRGRMKVRFVFDKAVREIWLGYEEADDPEDAG